MKFDNFLILLDFYSKKRNKNSIFFLSMINCFTLVYSKPNSRIQGHISSEVLQKKLRIINVSTTKHLKTICVGPTNLSKPVQKLAYNFSMKSVAPDFLKCIKNLESCILLSFNCPYENVLLVYLLRCQSRGFRQILHSVSGIEARKNNPSKSE